MRYTINKIAAVITVVLLLQACKKEPNFNYAEGKVGSSRITYFATFEMSGSQNMSLVKGTAFTDPGVKAKENGVEIPVTKTGTVDVNTVGLYTIEYSAKNKDGFASNITRYVAVLPAAETPGVNLSGTYTAVSASAGEAAVTKLAPGFYYTTNCWNGATTIPLYFMCVDGAQIIVPLQTGAFGRISSSSASISNTGRITWVLDLLDFGLTRTRIWQKK